MRTALQKKELIERWRVPALRIAVLPALTLPAFEATDEVISQSLADFVGSDENFIFIPGGLDQHDDLGKLFEIMTLISTELPELKFVLGGSWSDLSILTRKDLQNRFFELSAAAKTLMTGQLDRATENYLFQKSKVVLLATLNSEKLRFWRHSRYGLRSGSAMVFSELQIQDDELNWTQNQISLVTKSLSDAADCCLKLILDNELRDKMRNQVLELADRQATDDPSNHLSRIYSELLNR